MIFKISQNKLSDMINIAGKGISPNSPIPSLSGIKFDIHRDYIELTGSDADISIRTRADKSDDFVYDVEDEGSIIINKNYITEIIRKIDSDVVTMEITDGNQTEISGNKADFRINGFKAEDYPVIDFTKPENELTVPGAVLRQLVAQTSFATAVSETRPILTGINLSSDGTTLMACATDSYRMARKRVSMNLPFTFNVTVQAKSMNEIARTFGNDDTVHIAIGDKKIQFFNDSTLIQSRLIEGSYPDTSRFVPSAFGHDLSVNKRELLGAINRSTFIKSENDQFAIMKITMNRDEVILTSRTQEIGSLTENLNFTSYEGDPLELSFSSKYVAEALNGLDGENILIRFSGAMKPFVLTSIGDDTTLQLVLPVRAFN